MKKDYISVLTLNGNPICFNLMKQTHQMPLLVGTLGTKFVRAIDQPFVQFGMVCNLLKVLSNLFHTGLPMSAALKEIKA